MLVTANSPDTYIELQRLALLALLSKHAGGNIWHISVEKDIWDYHFYCWTEVEDEKIVVISNNLSIDKIVSKGETYNMEAILAVLTDTALYANTLYLRAVLG